MSSHHNPLVTIGIPTWNRAHYVCEALESALNQTYANLEIIVSDNASTDDTLRVLEEFIDPRIVLIRQPENRGSVANLNACLGKAAGDLFLLLSDDDLLDRHAIEKLSEPFRKGIRGISPEDIGMSWCPCLNIAASGRKMWETRRGPLLESPVSLMEGLLNGTRGPQFSGVMVRTKDAQAFGYDFSRHGVLCDSGNWGRVALQYDHVVCIQQPLVKYRIHGISDTSRADCAQWRHWGAQQHSDLVAVLESRGDPAGARRLLKGKTHMLANLTVTILMRIIGRPGWANIVVRELWRSRRIMFTPFVARRAVRDGWKLLKLKER